LVQSENIEIGSSGKFQTSLEYLLAELERIELMLHFRVKTRRLENTSTGGDALQSLYISEQEADNLEQDFTFLSEHWALKAGDPALKTFLELSQLIEEKINSHKQELLNQGQELRLDRLSKLFLLSRPEIDILLIGLLVEIDERYQRLYAYFQDDITKKLPTVGLVLQLLCDSLENLVQVREMLSPGAPLVKNQLVELLEDRNYRQTPISARIVRLNERITGYLLGSDRIDVRLEGLAYLVDRTRDSSHIIPDEIQRRLTGLKSRYRDRGLVVYMHDVQAAVQKAASRIGAVLEQPLLYVDLKRISAPDMSPGILIPLIFREGLLQKAALYFDCCDVLLNQDATLTPAFASLIEELKNYTYWVFLSGEKAWYPGDLLHNKPCINIEISPNTYSERIQIWEKYRNMDFPLARDINLADIAGKFRLSNGQIRDVIATARNLALWRDPEKGEISREDLYTACRQMSGRTLGVLTHRIQSEYRWEDMVLPADQVEQLHEICSYIENYQAVYSNWGFGRKLSTGKGLNILFAGPSGTGKTMAAGIVSHELKLDLYKVDLSAIVSKYIGETEKNLERIFQEGQISNAILFFDEADALFGKRSEVKDAHDRYANIEIAYLLQKMDEYEGIVILATNLRKNMDEAFARRIQFAIEFPLPDEGDRRRIWDIIFPSEAPLGPDVDLRFMSQFKITGGNIKNIALYSAFLAVRDGGEIRMEHLIRATRREYQKTGRLCTEEDFAQYFKLVKL
jgi:AAA+ superfamily predicted ATPase